ncbi:Aste57867_2820 [Aphanomyces stellatus]|uniref:Aste57867_2820 protein n=1 Tax=Aphanomyces stellatus TaxID=120398 RepID=A0A485KC54_9STRA|nr:hypothetical protein As57867_002813 [Aphanomyces stellatus]VFT80008.1 Aste57867_2820 [Aphanomyces stellatus]
MATTTTSMHPAVTEWKFPPPMVLAWKSPAFMPALTRRPLFSTTQPKKRVHFGTVTTYLFPLAYGGSAVPKDQGPPIGLASKHTQKACQDLHDTSNTGQRSRVRKFDHAERMALLQKAGYTSKEVVEMCLEAIDIRKSSLETEEDDKVDERETKRRRVDV